MKKFILLSFASTLMFSSSFTQGSRIAKTVIYNQSSQVLSSSSQSKNTTFPPLSVAHQCLSGEIDLQLMQDPSYQQKKQSMLEMIQSNIASRSADKGTVYTIPVVFHVIHKGEAVGSGTNISDAQIQSAIVALNRDFRKNSTIDGGIGFGIGVDTEIEFCLAKRDPSGNPTTGINRVNGTSVSGYSSYGISTGGSFAANDIAIKNLSKWDNRYYVNIWVVSEIDNNGADVANPSLFQGGTLGYAYLPVNNPITLQSQYDGIVVINLGVGNDPNNTQGFRLWRPDYTERGRVLTHEMGHHLGLPHTFSDANPSSCVDGDGIADTPPTAQGSTCNFQICTNAMVENYMDYTSETCQNTYTAGQSAVMRAVLVGNRSQLVNTNNCTSPINYDLEVVSITYPDSGFCGTSLSPEVVVRNNGGLTLTSFQLSSNIDGNITSHSWTGSLTAGQTTSVILPTQTISVGAHTYTASVVTSSLNGSNTDGVAGNNSKSRSFTNVAGTSVDILVETDCFASETGIELRNTTTNQLVASGSGYSNNANGLTISANFCLSDACYKFKVTDSFGDGFYNDGTTQGCSKSSGNYAVTAGANVLVQMPNGGSNFGDSAVHTFCLPTVQNDTVIANFSASSTNVVAGSTVIFTDISTATPSATTWSWNFGGGGTPNVSNVQNPSIQFNSAGTYTVTLTVGNGSNSDIETKTNYIIVTTAPSFSCDELSSYTSQDTITAYTLNAGGYYPGTNTNNITEFAEKFTATNAYVTGVSFPVFEAQNPSGGSSVKINVYSDNANSPGTLLGSFTKGLSQLTTGQYNFLDFTQPVSVNGNFWVAVQMLTNSTSDTMLFGTTNIGSSNPSTTKIKQNGVWSNVDALFTNIHTKFVLDVFTGPNVSIVASSTNVNVGQSVNFGTSGGTLSSTKWYFTANDSSSLASPSFTFSTPGTYTVYLNYVSGSCERWSQVDIVVSQTTTIIENLVANIQIYPNPSNDNLYIESDLLKMNAVIQLFDMQGKKVMEQTSNSKAKETLFIESLNKGTYLLKIIVPNHTIINRKIVKN